MSSSWKNNIPDLFAALDGEPVVPNDSADLSPGTRALYVGVSGDVRVTMKGGTVLDFTAAPVGTLPICVTRVHATGTTATSILALK